MNISSHKDKKWSSWEYDNSNERYYRYRITRNGDYEYDWQPAPAASTAGETRDNPEIATNVEQITQGLSQFNVGDEYSETVDDLAEDEDEDLQAAKRESRSIFQHPQAGDESGPSSASAYHYAQTQDLSAVYEDGSSSGSTHVYSNAQDPYGNEAAGRTTPRPGEYSVVYTIQNVLQDENQLDSRKN
ncbi:hypothetical protein S40285_08941 [Stachybotrys chlorohalonatus IBT 40285]|uniref:Uncharacterized protein n=1 Tax=Stachybotrys chlorohalonatus (strain IBT 40285) TaxID=1283841 RepID=A0A084QC41_STAC4|nr:hypothetical protein S40285_08941 [Stachybotrys chlorohalonata IBT 40285]